MNLIKLLAKALNTTPDNIEYKGDNIYDYGDTEYIVGTYDEILDIYVDSCQYNYEDGFDEGMSLSELKEYVNEDKLSKYFVKNIKNYLNEEFDDDEILDYAREYSLLDDVEEDDVDIEWLRKKLSSYLIAKYLGNPMKFYFEDTTLGGIIDEYDTRYYNLIDSVKYFEDYFKEYVAERMFKIGNDTYAIKEEDMNY